MKPAACRTRNFNEWQDTMSLLRAEHITQKYGDTTIIQEISLRLEQGELVSLLGLSGSGKTTLFHVLSGLTRPAEGKVFLEDEEVTGLPGKISYMLQKDLLSSFEEENKVQKERRA